MDELFSFYVDFETENKKHYDIPFMVFVFCSNVFTISFHQVLGDMSWFRLCVDSF